MVHRPISIYWKPVHTYVLTPHPHQPTSQPHQPHRPPPPMLIYWHNKFQSLFLLCAPTCPAWHRGHSICVPCLRVLWKNDWSRIFRSPCVDGPGCTCTDRGLYSISQEICTRFCCALPCCGYAIVHNVFTWSIYPDSSGLLCWHWGNR